MFQDVVLAEKLHQLFMFFARKSYSKIPDPLTKTRFLVNLEEVCGCTSILQIWILYVFLNYNFLIPQYILFVFIYHVHILILLYIQIAALSSSSFQSVDSGGCQPSVRHHQFL
jgi:hypothetical protein